MNELVAFLRGMAIGFAIAAPVGPVGVLCIRRALADGRAAAFVAGMGAAVADTFYGGVAGFGLTYISKFLAAQATPLRLIGGLFLLYMGWRGLKSRAVLVATPTSGPGLVKDFVTTLVITLTNPGTIFAFMGVFAAMGTVDIAGNGGFVVLGVFVGSSAWWLLLSAAAGAVRSSFTPVWLHRLNRGSAIGLLLFGVAVIGSLAL